MRTHRHRLKKIGHEGKRKEGGEGRQREDADAAHHRQSIIYASTHRHIQADADTGTAAHFLCRSAAATACETHGVCLCALIGTHKQGKSDMKNHHDLS